MNVDNKAILVLCGVYMFTCCLKHSLQITQQQTFKIVVYYSYIRGREVTCSKQIGQPDSLDLMPPISRAGAHSQTVARSVQCTAGHQVKKGQWVDTISVADAPEGHVPRDGWGLAGHSLSCA